jgi:nicotinamide-nucleotide amidase
MSGSGRAPASAIVTVGNELLYGETVDTNAAWLGRILAGWGLPVAKRYTVGDIAEDIRETVSLALKEVELVVVTGGLGPTRDDLTKGVVADLMGRSLVRNEDAWHALQAHFRAAGEDEVPELSRGQADVPEGARVLVNPRGTAPGIVLDAGEALLVLLPGVPDELEAIVEGGLLSAIDGRLGDRRRGHVVHHRVVHTTGIVETHLAERLEKRLEALPDDITDGIDLAYLPDVLGVDLRLSIRGGGPDEAERRFDVFVESITDLLGEWQYEASDGDLAEAVSAELRRSGRTVAVAESCTGGLVAKRLTDRAGASEILVGGVVAYADAVKIGEVGVKQADLQREGAVSETVARQLSERVAERLGADTGIGVTGVAGPGGGSLDKPVGTVWIATTVGGETEAVRHRFAGDRLAVREASAQAALAQLYRRLRDDGAKG